MSAPAGRRRPRVAFHYKVDEDLRPQDREPYLALLRHPRTRIDDAHRWLLGRGYVLSRSAVARHRRRLLSGEAEHHATLDRILALARLSGSADGAPDLAAAAEAYWKHLVFERLLAAGSPRAGEAGQAPGAAPQPLTPAELLDLGKLVAQAIDLTRRRAQQTLPAAAGPGAARVGPPRSDEQLRKHIEDILFNGK